MMEIGRGDSSRLWTKRSLGSIPAPLQNFFKRIRHSKIFVVPQSSQRRIKKINKLSYAALRSLISKVTKTTKSLERTSF